MRRPGNALIKAVRLVRAVGAAVTVPDVLIGRPEHRRGGFMPCPPCLYDEAENWEPVLHEVIGAPGPCPKSEKFRTLWGELVDGLTASGTFIGRGEVAPGTMETPA
jgi:hypothetical protein